MQRLYFCRLAAGSKALSILYLRCEAELGEVAEAEASAFNSLFEMLFRSFARLLAFASGTFNSLFEMHRTRLSGTAPAAPLSILYLRCRPPHLQ